MCVYAHKNHFWWEHRPEAMSLIEMNIIMNWMCDSSFISSKPYAKLKKKLYDIFHQISAVILQWHRYWVLPWWLAPVWFPLMLALIYLWSVYQKPLWTGSLSVEETSNTNKWIDLMQNTCLQRVCCIEKLHSNQERWVCGMIRRRYARMRTKINTWHLHRSYLNELNKLSTTSLLKNTNNFFKVFFANRLNA